MKGMLIKDLRTVLNNNRSFLLLAVAIVFFIAFMDDMSFVLGYITVLCSMLVLGTISYDELDNGFSFLFTLPITRKSYVKSKYLFSILYTVIVWLATCIVVGIISNVKGTEFDLSFSLGVVASCFIFQSIMIPVQYKFGVEKSRVALAVIIGVVFAIGAAIMMFLAKIGFFADDITELVKSLSTISSVVLTIAILIVTGLIMFVSYLSSVKVVESKEL